MPHMGSTSRKNNRDKTEVNSPLCLHHRSFKLLTDVHGRISEVEILCARNVRYNIIINTIELLQRVSKTGTSREKWWGIPKTSLSGEATVAFLHSMKVWS